MSFAKISEKCVPHILTNRRQISIVYSLFYRHIIIKRLGIYLDSCKMYLTKVQCALLLDLKKIAYNPELHKPRKFYFVYVISNVSRLGQKPGQLKINFTYLYINIENTTH